MTIKALYPTFRPILNLDFAKTKALDPRVTFTRASTGTFVGSNGLIQTAASGTARFDHNPATGESLGLLVEEARTNRALYSEQFDNAYWGANAATVTTNSTVAPDGANTADTFAEDATSGTHVLFAYPSSPVQSGSNTFSCYAKAKERSVFALSVNGSIGHAWAAATFNLSSGVITQSGQGTVNLTLTGAQMFNAGNGWYRCCLSFSSTSTSAYVSLQIVNTPSYAYGGYGRYSYSGDGTSGIYIWGAQAESPAIFPTSYIPTTGSTVTRAADVATVSNTGSSIFPVSAFTTVNSPFGTAGGGSTVKLLGPTVKRTAVYAGYFTQAQINALAGVNDGFWRWRVLGSTFALPNFTTNGSVTVDWGDGVVETLTTAAHTFTNGGGYHDIGFRLNSGTFFKPAISNNATYKDRVIALGPAPASMKIDPNTAFHNCTALRSFDATLDVSGGTNLNLAWSACTGLTSFPLINTAAGTSFNNAWSFCIGLTSFPLINTAAGTNFNNAWWGCSGLTTFPLISTVAGTSFQQTWNGCSSLTAFPAINMAAGTNFQQTWNGCSSLTAFPAINMAAGTNFQEAWRNCSSLTAFPAINMTAGTNFYVTWYECSSLTSFPANMFNTTGTLDAGAFSGAFQGCALTATSIENILTSLVTNGQSNITLGLSGGTNAGASTWTANAVTAYDTLISRGWAITRNA